MCIDHSRSEPFAFTVDNFYSWSRVDVFRDPDDGRPLDEHIGSIGQRFAAVVSAGGDDAPLEKVRRHSWLYDLLGRASPFCSIRELTHGSWRVRDGVCRAQRPPRQMR